MERGLIDLMFHVLMTWPPQHTQVKIHGHRVELQEVRSFCIPLLFFFFKYSLLQSTPPPLSSPQQIEAPDQSITLAPFFSPQQIEHAILQEAAAFPHHNASPVLAAVVVARDDLPPSGQGRGPVGYLLVREELTDR